MTQTTLSAPPASLDSLSDLELAHILAQRLGITAKDWHRLKGNRKAQASQSLGTALVYLLKDQPEEALTHLNQAKGWLDRSIAPLPCPSHGNH